MCLLPRTARVRRQNGRNNFKLIILRWSHSMAVSRRNFMYHCKGRISMVCLNQAVLGTAIVGFHYCNRLPLPSPAKFNFFVYQFFKYYLLWSFCLHFSPWFANSLRLMFPCIWMLMYVTTSINYWGLIHVPYHVHTPFQMAQYKPYSSDCKNNCDHRSYESSLNNCVKKPEKVRTSTGFEPVTSRYRCDALTNWAMKPLTLRAGHLWVAMSPWRMDVKWYMKCFIYWTADFSGFFRFFQLCTLQKQLVHLFHLNIWRNKEV